MNMHQTPLSGLRARHDDSTAVRDFRDFLLAKSAERHTDLKRRPVLLNDGVVAELKAATPAAGVSSLSSPFSLALERLIHTNAPRSAFNAMKPSMTEVPLRTRIIVSAATVEASQVAEGAAKLFRSISLSELDTETSKHAAAVALSQEFIDMAPALAGRVLADMLAAAVARSADGYFLGKLNAVESDDANSSATDPSFQAMLNDLSELLRRLKTGENSKVFFIMRPAALKWLSAAAFGSGISSVLYNGGSLMGVQLSDQTASPLALLPPPMRQQSSTVMMALRCGAAMLQP